MKTRYGVMLFVRMASGVSGARRMKAWRIHNYGSLSELRFEDARVPPLRAPDELLVRVRYASINPLDVAMIGGYGSRVLNVLRSVSGVTGSEGVEFPLVCGRDFSGDVVAAGPGSRLHAGQRVWGVVPPHWPGSHAQYVVVRDQWAGVAPPRLSAAAAGGALYAGLTACALLRAAGVPPGRAAGGRPGPPPGRAAGGRPGAPPRLLLLGLGGVGQAALQLLAHAGAQTVVGCSEPLCELALRLGAAEALDRRRPDYPRRLRDAGPFDAVLDCAGLGGGAAAGDTLPCSFRRLVTLSSPLLRETDARGVWCGALSAAGQLAAQCARAAARSSPAPPPPPPPPHVRWAYFVPCAADIELLRRLADRDQWSVRVQQVWPAERAAAAYERLAAGGARGKLLLRLAGTDTDTDTDTDAAAC